MKDLVETVISQVMQKQPSLSPSGKASAAGGLQGASFTQELAKARTMQPPEVKDKALWDVCCKFESMFVQQMMSAMRKTIPQSGFLKQGYAEDVHASMFDQAVSDSAGKQAGLGIAVNMYRQLERAGGDSHKKIQEIDGIADNMSLDAMRVQSGDIHGKD